MTLGWSRSVRAPDSASCLAAASVISSRARATSVPSSCRGAANVEDIGRPDSTSRVAGKALQIWAASVRIPAAGQPGPTSAVSARSSGRAEVADRARGLLSRQGAEALSYGVVDRPAGTGPASVVQLEPVASQVGPHAATPTRRARDERRAGLGIRASRRRSSRASCRPCRQRGPARPRNFPPASAKPVHRWPRLCRRGTRCSQPPPVHSGSLRA